MTGTLQDFIRELSEIYDPDSEDTFISVYQGQSLDKKFLERRIKACKSILKKNELENFNKTINEIIPIVDKNKKNNIAIFSSYKNHFLQQLLLTVDIENLLVVDSSPYLRPLARILDEWESFTLLLLSSNYAKIFSVSLGKIMDTKKLSSDIINKHKKGGMSQARFNRLRRGAIHKFLSEVIEELQKNAEKEIIIAGPGTTKNKFIDLLPRKLREKVVDSIDISINDENQLLKKSLHIISEKESRKSEEAVKDLKAEILKDGLAVYGIGETIQAVKNGQVELLIIEKDWKPRGWICENCQYVGEGIKKKCPYCNNETSQVDVLEEILEFAERTDAEIEFTNAEEIKKLGHVGGILRYK